MAKFCSNCGTALSEGAVFCHNCGSQVPQAAPAPQFIPVEQAQPQFIPAEPVAPAPQYIPAQQAQPQFVPAYQPAPQFVPAAPAKKKVSKKALIIGGVVAAVAVIAVVLIFVLGGGAASSPQRALDNYVALMNGDTSMMEDLAPAEYWEYVAEEEGMTKKQLLAEWKMEIAENVADMKQDYGSNYKVTGKILDEQNMDNNTLKKITAGLTKYGIKENSIKAGKELSIKLTLTHSEGKEDAPVRTLGAVQIGDSWYLVNYYENNDGSYRVYFYIE